MSTPAPGPLRVRLVNSFAELPPAAQAFFATAGAGDLFQTLDWVTRAHGRRPGDQLRLCLVENEAAAGEPMALLPALYSRLYGSHPGARVLHFLQPQEQPYQPLTSEQGVHSMELARALTRWLSANAGSYDVLRISPLDPQSAFSCAVLEALRGSSHWLQSYRYNSDRYVPVAGVAAAEYLSQRPRRLREVLEVNTRLLMQGGRGQFNLVCTPELLQAAWRAIQYLVDATPSERNPDAPGYVEAMLIVAAEAGALRMGIFYLDEIPMAMQLWVVNQGVAQLLRLWEVQGQCAFPIDDVLTQLMALCLIDGEHVAELDFGHISDEFAADWAPMARARIGVAAFNRRTWRGARGALRHIGLQLLKSGLMRIRNRLFGRR